MEAYTSSQPRSAAKAASVFVFAAAVLVAFGGLAFAAGYLIGKVLL